MSQSLHDILLHVHSVGRWLLMLLLLIAIFNSLVAGQRPFIKSDARTGLILTIVADTMLLLGLALWFFGPFGYAVIQSMGFKAAMQNDGARFFVMEHTVGMLIAIVLIHIGKAQAKKKIIDRKKHVRTMVFYLVALLVILASVPWPFLTAGAGRGWF